MIPASSGHHPAPSISAAVNRSSAGPRDRLRARAVLQDTQRKTFADFESMLRGPSCRAGRRVRRRAASTIPNTHALEVAMLEGFLRRHASVGIGLEMFERDVQGAVNQYRARGLRPKEQFLGACVPGRRYDTITGRSSSSREAHHLPVTAVECAAPDRQRRSEDADGRRRGSGRSSDLAARDLECPTSGDYYAPVPRADGRASAVHGDSKSATRRRTTASIPRNA